MSRRAPHTLPEAVEYFADEDVALRFAADVRWPDGKQVCPRCGSKDRHTFLKTRRLWKCRSCRKQFSVKLGTVVEDSSIGLSKWLAAMWLLANTDDGVSSHGLARDLGVTQKTAWLMLRRIRVAMRAQ